MPIVAASLRTAAARAACEAEREYNFAMQHDTDERERCFVVTDAILSVVLPNVRWATCIYEGVEVLEHGDEVVALEPLVTTAILEEAASKEVEDE